MSNVAGKLGAQRVSPAVPPLDSKLGWEYDHFCSLVNRGTYRVDGLVNGVVFYHPQFFNRELSLRLEEAFEGM